MSAQLSGMSTADMGTVRDRGRGYSPAMGAEERCPTHPFLLHMPTGQRVHVEFCLKGAVAQ